MDTSLAGPGTGLDFLVAPLALRPGVVLTVVDGGAVVLADEARVVVFDADPERTLLPLIDGVRSGRELASASPSGSSLEAVERLLRLQSAGWIEVVRQPLRVAVTADSPQAAQELRAAIDEDPGLTLVGASDDAPDLEVLLAADYLDGSVEEAMGRAAGAVLLVRAGLRTAWIGPILVAGDTACWECLAHRLRRNREGHALVADGASGAVGVADVDWLRPWIVQQLLAYRQNAATHPLRGALVYVDAESLSASRHVVTRRPQCPRCGSPAADPAPIRLHSRPRVGDGDSGFRALEPRSLLRQYGHHVSPITGVTRGIWPVGDSEAVHLARAPHIPAEPASSWGQLRAKGRGAAGGKGTTELQARASALGESLERYCSSWDGTEPTEEASYAELAAGAEPVLHPRDCMLFSDRQYEERESRNAKRISFKQTVPRPFDPEERIHWARVWSLTNERWTRVAAPYVYFGAPQGPRGHTIVGESNGNAAGASLEDAVLQGFFELVERDCVALWWYNGLRKPGVDLDGIDDAYLGPLREHFAAIGRELWVLDLTADLGVPAFVCVSRRLDDGPDQVTMGFGAHLDARTAILRSVTEMSQLMPAALREIERPDRLPDELQREGTSFHLRVEDTPYLRPDPARPPRTLADFEPVDSDDLGALARRCQEMVEAAGMEMLVHDLTRPDVGLPVVKVIVPGMRHFWPRFAPGRLYDVPVAMGWRAEPLAEDEINPVLLNG